MNAYIYCVRNKRGGRIIYMKISNIYYARNEEYDKSSNIYCSHDVWHYYNIYKNETR